MKRVDDDGQQSRRVTTCTTGKAVYDEVFDEANKRRVDCLRVFCCSFVALDLAKSVVVYIILGNVADVLQLTN